MSLPPPDMIGALFYLQSMSLLNRVVRRIKRLKQPKYLLGAIVGGAYFYFYFIRYLFGIGRPNSSWSLGSASADLALFEGIGAAGLMLMVLVGWILPRERAALAFSEAEVAFLFQAPISRRGLIHYKLLRSQTAILFTSLFLMLLSNRMGGRLWIHVAGWWVILSTLNLHLLGASFARTMLLDRGITNWQRRAAILMLLGGVVVVVFVWAQKTLPQFALSEFQRPEQVKQYFRELLISGPVPWLLLPFRLVVRPYLAQSASSFFLAILPALAIMGLHYFWVVHSNVSFEEASVDASRKLAEKVHAVRSGNWHRANQVWKVRRAPFVLKPEGPPSIALLWKNLISAGQAFTWRMWLMLAILGGSAAIAISQSARFSNLASVLGMIVGTFLIWSLLLGPQFLRQDFRQDMQLADVLKGYPLRGWQVAVGELLAPTVILSSIQWGLLTLAVVLLLGKPIPGLGGPVVIAIALGMAITVPMLNLLTLQIPNAAVLLFPAWFQAGKEGPQGIEATGQRIIFMLGQLLAFILAMIPATLAFTIVFFASKFLAVILPLGILAGSIAAAVVLAAEGILGILLLGRLFEKFDLSTEQAP